VVGATGSIASRNSHIFIYSLPIVKQNIKATYQKNGILFFPQKRIFSLAFGKKTYKIGLP
jgi:hypothetical protein